MEIITDALVLRYANYRENDRMLTLFSPTLGQISAMARGCRRPKSPLLASGEMFCLGQYVLHQVKGHTMVAQCSVQDSHYALRMEMERLAAAVYMANLCEEAVHEGEGNAPLFAEILIALAYLCHSDKPLECVVAYFVLRLMQISGYRPVLDVCVRCGKTLTIPHFDARRGGVCCGICGPDTPLVAPRTVDWMRAALKVVSRPERLLDYPVHARETLILMAPFVAQRYGRIHKSAAFLETLLSSGIKQ